MRLSTQAHLAIHVEGAAKFDVGSQCNLTTLLIILQIQLSSVHDPTSSLPLCDSHYIPTFSRWSAGVK